MENEIKQLLEEIKTSRDVLIQEINGLSNHKGSKKIDDNSWNIQGVIEHLVLAERGGFNLIYTAAEAFRNGNPVWDTKSENEGLSIEQIIDNTWKAKETAPESATPSGKWSLEIWTAHFINCDDLLTNLEPILKGLPLNKVIYPHFLCGPLNVIQRLEFIRFHIDRHFLQILEMKKKLSV